MSVKFPRILMIAACALLMVGCQSKQKKEAYQHWNATRASVQGSLAAERYKMGSLDDARKAIDQAIALDPKNAKFRILSARIHIERNQLEAADQELASARTINPKDGEADYLAGIIYQRWQKSENALDYYVQACEKAPEQLSYLMARAEMLVQLNRMNEAVNLIESKLTYFEYSGPLRDMLGGLYLQQARLKDGIDMLHQATILANDDVAIREHYARALFRGEQFRECLSQLDMLLKNEANQKRADLLMLKGECHLSLKQYREARAALESSLEQNPSSVAALLALAKVSIANKDMDRAELSLKKALALREDDARIFLSLGYLRMEQGQLPEAMKMFVKASELEPTDSMALCMIGLVYEKQNNSAEAMRYYGKALQLRPDDKFAKSLLSSAR